MAEKKPSDKYKIAAGGALVVIAIGILVYTHWPQRQADLNQVFYSDDDGQTWFADSTFKVAPFDHNGKPADIAEIYTYDDGKKQFCAYLARYTPDAKAQLEKALADAKAHGQPLGSVGLYHDRGFTQRGMEAKKPGAGHPWVSYSDPHVNDVFSVQSPDGSAVDQLFVY